SDYDMSCTYAMLESPMRVENYVATLSLTPVTTTNETFAEWRAEFDAAPEREEGLVQHIGSNVFAAALASLRERFRR
ncbi:MAG TPA: SRPBCC family protein, partial [Paracoccaceae bacterium]|nr:SRPBCC family protein [Paracoccaceae bacterium]